MVTRFWFWFRRGLVMRIQCSRTDWQTDSLADGASPTSDPQTEQDTRVATPAGNVAALVVAVVLLQSFPHYATFVVWHVVAFD